MNKIAILCPTVPGFAQRYVDAARRLNLEPVVMLYRDAPFDTSGFADAQIHYVDALTGQCDDIVEQLRQMSSVVGIVPGGEFAVEACEYAARSLGLERGMLGEPAILRNKFRMREAFERAGVPQPKRVGIVQSVEEAGRMLNDVCQYPLISKPVDMAGSLFVHLNSNRDEVLANIAPVFEYKTSKVTGLEFAGMCLLEEYFDGQEYSAEVIVYRGEIVEVFVNQKYVSPLPHFDEIGHLCGVRFDAQIEALLADTIERVISAASVNSTVLHVEFKLDATGRIAIIEVGCRIAGDFIARLVELQHGVSLEAAMLALRTGQRPAVARLQQATRYGIRFLFHAGTPLTASAGTVVEQSLYQPPRTPQMQLNPVHLNNRIGYEILRLTATDVFIADDLGVAQVG